MKLMDLNSQYFWVVSAGIRAEKPPQDAVVQCRRTAWEVADLLRQCDKVEYLDETLEILFSVNIASANERANRLNALLDKLGKLVNPACAKHIARISQANVMSLGMKPEVKNNAPGSWQLPQ